MTKRPSALTRAVEPYTRMGVCPRRPGGTGITESSITESQGQDVAALPAGRKPSQQVLAAVLSGGADIGALIRAPDGNAPRILVGEPDSDTRDRLIRVLGSAGCRVETASDGRSAFAAAAGDPPDLIVADASVPRRHGFAPAPRRSRD